MNHFIKSIKKYMEMKVMKHMVEIYLKYSFYLRYPLKTLFIAFISMITFAALTIYMSINPLNILFTPEVMNIISTQIKSFLFISFEFIWYYHIFIL